MRWKMPFGRADAKLITTSTDTPVQVKAKAFLMQGTDDARIGKFDDALRAFETSIETDPSDPAAYLERGYALKDLGRAAESYVAFSQALERFSYHVRLLNGQGLALSDLGRHEEALASFEAAIRAEPDHAGSHSNAARELLRLSRLEDAIERARHALVLDSTLTPAMQTLKDALFRQGAVDDALLLCHQIVRDAPSDVTGLMLRAVALEELDRHPAALESYLGALHLSPGNPYAAMNAGLSALRMGLADPGWKLWEARHQMPAALSTAPDAAVAGSHWNGTTAISGRRIFIYPEQGHGDTIQFMRYVPVLRALGAEVVIGFAAPLEPLYPNMPHVETVKQNASISRTDLHCSLLSIPAALLAAGLLPEIPAPYRPDGPSEEKKRFWQHRLGVKQRPRVGLVVSGNPEHSNDRNRSVPLSQLIELLALPLEFISLQPGLRAEDEISAKGSTLRLFDGIRDFGDTAALAQSCDLIISVDSAPVHVAASLGRPTWLLLPHLADWRWGVDDDASAWYSSVRLFRQGVDRHWQPVIEAVIKEVTSQLVR